MSYADLAEAIAAHLLSLRLSPTAANIADAERYLLARAES